MYETKVKYEDYNGNHREETLNFNLNETEFLEWEMMTPGGLENLIDKILEKKDRGELYMTFKNLILKAYGVKTDDGRRFMKTDAIREEFLQTEAYNQFMLKLSTDNKVAAAFINGITPKGVSKFKVRQDGKIEVPKEVIDKLGENDTFVAAEDPITPYSSDPNLGKPSMD